MYLIHPGRTQGRPSLKQGVVCLETLPDFLAAPSEWTSSVTSQLGGPSLSNENVE